MPILSQVDGHFHREFNRSEVYELHGSVEQWQCAGDPESNAREPCDGTLWELDPSFRFRVDADTMRAEPDEVIKCRKCKGQGRPNVLMFHDKQWIANTRDEVSFHCYPTQPARPFLTAIL
jgi:NAD-dependent SIR2 family protein deacetylase